MTAPIVFSGSLVDARNVAAHKCFRLSIDIPAELARAEGTDVELDFDAAHATYYLSRLSITRGEGKEMQTWRKRIFIGMSHNAANPADSFCLPVGRTIVMGANLEL